MVVSVAAAASNLGSSLSKRSLIFVKGFKLFFLSLSLELFFLESLLCSIYLALKQRRMGGRKEEASFLDNESFPEEFSALQFWSAVILLTWQPEWKEEEEKNQPSSSEIGFALSKKKEEEEKRKKKKSWRLKFTNFFYSGLLNISCIKAFLAYPHRSRRFIAHFAKTKKFENFFLRVAESFFSLPLLSSTFLLLLNRRHRRSGELTNFWLSSGLCPSSRPNIVLYQSPKICRSTF